MFPQHLPHFASYTSGHFFLLAGPCAVEGEQLLMDTAGELSEMCRELEIPLVFKSSYRKANRTHVGSFTGIGDEAALEALRRVRETFSVPVVTDIHESHEAELAARYVDMLQIPAFLCRQTELLLAAGRTGKHVNIKKGQFVDAGAMRHAADKVRSTGNPHVLVTDRGNLFGYHDLVVDFRNLPLLREACAAPVVMDCTHAVQRPNDPSGITGGQRRFVDTIARAAVAVGVDGLFVETHPRPDQALSDAANMVPLGELRPLLEKWLRIHRAAQGD
jgi:2-dehydro-3-deoxyphosphooctonate aldolase (KDO 8-P synthase)